jgi:hypothetical protein
MKARNPVVVLFWSFGIFLIAHLSQYVGILIASIVSGASFESIIEGNFSNHLTILFRGLTAAVVGIPLVLVTVRYLWRRSSEWMRFRFSFKLLVLGFLFGLVLPVLTVVLVSLIAVVRVVGTPDRFTMGELPAIVFGSIGFAVFTAAVEELVFRGMAVREWALKWGWGVASIVGGVYFGAVHILGLLPHVSVVEVLWILLAAIVGNLLCVALYIRSKSLWFPIGFHAGWNLCLKAILGTTMSGKTSDFALYGIEISGHSLVTGGKFGLEASVVSMAVLLAVVLVLLRCSTSGKPVLLSPVPDRVE